MTSIKADQVASLLALTQEAERLACQRSFLRFLSHVIIPDPPPVGSGDVQFVQWPALMRLNAVVDQHRVTFVLKSRKIGVTSLFEARFSHKAMWQRNSFFPVMSQGEKEAFEAIYECRYIWEHLPEWLRPDLVDDNKEMLSFKGGGKIEAFPATAKAGRSYTGTEILMDEADFHEQFEASYNALLPLIQDTGGKMIVVSTANSDLVDSPFRRKYLQADGEVVGRLFLGYYDRPGRTEATFNRAEEMSSDKARFEKENARTEEEALAPPVALRYFDTAAVTALASNTVKPVEFDKGGLVWIWKRPIIGQKYIAFGDVAWGEKGAYSCVVFANFNTLEQVYEIYGRPSSDELALWIVDTGKALNGAYIGVEANGEGITVVNTMIELGYGHRMYHRKDDWQKEEKHRGWLTDGFTRPIMLEKLANFIRAQNITPRCRDATTEMLSFIRVEKAGKLRPEAIKGAYADHVIAWAGLLQMHEVARWAETDSKPIYVKSSW